MKSVLSIILAASATASVAEAKPVATAQIAMSPDQVIQALQKVDNTMKLSSDSSTGLLVLDAQHPAKVSLVLSRLYSFRERVESDAGLADHKADVVNLTLAAKNGGTEVTLDDSSIVGGTRVDSSIGVCQRSSENLKVKSPKCVNFTMKLNGQSELNLTVDLEQATTNPENDRSNATVILRYVGSAIAGHSWILKSEYGNGNDVDDVDYVIVGSDLLFGKVRRTHVGAKSRNH